MANKKVIATVIAGEGLLPKPGSADHIARRQHQSNRTPLSARKSEAYGLIASTKHTVEMLAGHGMVDLKLATSGLVDLRERVQKAETTQQVRAVVSDIRDTKKGYETTLKGKEFAQAGGLIEGIQTE